MTEEIKGIAGLLEDLADTSPKDKTPEDIERDKLTSLSIDDKAAKAFDNQMRGIPVSAIAAAFGVDQSTVYRWLSHYSKQYRQRLEQEPAANIISESLLFLTRIEELCLYEANQSDVDGATFDSATGEVTRPKSYQASSNKAKFIQSAMKARQMKTDLMIQTGILPKEPERLYHAFDTEKRDKEDLISTALSRSPDEIRKDIEQLLSKGRTI
jgi:transposase-like protein